MSMDRSLNYGALGGAISVILTTPAGREALAVYLAQKRTEIRAQMLSECLEWLRERAFHLDHDPETMAHGLLLEAARVDMCRDLKP